MTEKKSIADALDVKPHDEGLKGSVDRAVERVPIAGDAYKSIKSIKESIGEVDDVTDLGNLAKDMASSGASFIAGAYADAAFFAMDPIGYLVSAGLDMLLELVQPLQDALHYVSGDGPSLSAGSDNFATIAQGFVALSEDFDETADKALKDWQEDAGNAARQAVADFSVGIQGVGSAAGAVSEVLKTWSMIMQVIEEVIKGIITELVSWLITLWLPALASSVISFGGSVAAAMTATVAKVASVFSKVSRYLGKLGKLLEKLGEFLVKFNGTVVRLAEKFRLGKTVAAGSRTAPLVGQKVARDTFVPSRRVAATTAGAMAKGMGSVAGNFEQRLGTMFSKEALKALGIGASIKAGTGALKGGIREPRDSYEDVLEGEPAFDKSEIGGDRDPDETRKNLDI